MHDDSNVGRWLLLLRDGTEAEQQLARTELGLILEARGMLDEAAEAFERNVADGTTDRRPYERLAAIARLRGDPAAEARALRGLAELLLPSPSPPSPPLPAATDSDEAPADDAADTPAEADEPMLAEEPTASDELPDDEDAAATAVLAESDEPAESVDGSEAAESAPGEAVVEGEPADSEDVPDVSVSEDEAVAAGPAADALAPATDDTGDLAAAAGELPPDEPPAVAGEQSLPDATSPNPDPSTDDPDEPVADSDPPVAVSDQPLADPDEPSAAPGVPAAPGSPAVLASLDAALLVPDTAPDEPPDDVSTATDASPNEPSAALTIDPEAPLAGAPPPAPLPLPSVQLVPDLTAPNSPISAPEMMSAKPIFAPRSGAGGVRSPEAGESTAPVAVPESEPPPPSKPVFSRWLPTLIGLVLVIVVVGGALMVPVSRPLNVAPAKPTGSPTAPPQQLLAAAATTQPSPSPSPTEAAAVVPAPSPTVVAAALPARCADVAQRFPESRDSEAAVRAAFQEYMTRQGVTIDPSSTLFIGLGEAYASRHAEVLAGWMAVTLQRERRGLPTFPLVDYVASDIIVAAGPGEYQLRATVSPQGWNELRGLPADSCEGAFLRSPDNARWVELMQANVGDITWALPTPQPRR